jgi:photosystem II stability/assembly factor-like uncharacterized protein
MQESGTTAGLRGIYSVDGKIAWASGTEGTVLKTIDGGEHWQKCAVPGAGTDGATMDFRGVQALDREYAWVLASGPGEKSRIYHTQDGCKTWKLLLKNLDPKGFWDAFAVVQPTHSNLDDLTEGVVVGDPTYGRFDLRVLTKSGDWDTKFLGCEAMEGEGSFAASNSSLVLRGTEHYILGTGGKSGSFVLFSPLRLAVDADSRCKRVSVPMASGSEATGIFSLQFRDDNEGAVVGGDYTKPTESTGTAAWTDDGGRNWTAAIKMPHGYRSSVAWSEKLKAWITAGTNGSDISRDDGKTWQPLDDGNWNALSLPFVVGPKGRIARLSLEPKK